MKAASAPDPSWPDRQLVECCLEGSDLAWRALVDKYQKLVYAVIMKYRPDSESAADIFQAVWLDVFNDLGGLRNRDGVKPWLLTLTRNKCFHWKRHHGRIHDHEVTRENGIDVEAESQVDAEFADQMIRDQLVRESISMLPTRCQEMIHLLFFAKPPLPYKNVAEKLGLATGSIGFIRGRCLKKLQKALEELGAL